MRLLFESWWDNHHTHINPPAVVSGDDVMGDFHLQPGPLIGEILEAVREAQVIGLIQTREDALVFIGEYIQDDKA